MEKRKWLWKRRSSERSPGETESSGSLSSHSERFSDDQQDALKTSQTDDAQSPEVTSKTVASDDDAVDSIKILTEKLSAALKNVSAKDDLVKQHTKVAEEAVAGWEKAENEVVALKNQLESAIHHKSALENRVSHLDGALKECVRQLRQARDEQEEKIHESMVNIKYEIDPVLQQKLEYLEEENKSLKVELLSRLEELEVRTIERDLSTQTAETASKQHLESIKKVAKLEAECRRLKSIVCKSSSINDHKNSAASSIYVESLTDSQSDSGERLNALELDAHKISCSEPYKSEPSCSNSWASALIVELDQFKNDKTVNKNIPVSSTEIDLMDDFLEMEQLAALPDTENMDHQSEPVDAKQPIDAERSLREELEVMINRTAELEERLRKTGDEKVELEENLENMKAVQAELEENLQMITREKVELEEKLENIQMEKAELEMDLTKSLNKNEIQLREAQLRLEELQGELSLSKESSQKLESQLVSLEAEARTMSAKVLSLEAEIEREKFLSAGTAAKCQQLEEELSKKKHEVEMEKTANANIEPKIKQEDLAVAAGKLAECQKTIASLGQQLKSLATLEDFFSDASSLPEFSTGGSRMHRVSGEPWRLHSNETFSPKGESGSSMIASEVGPSLDKKEGKSTPSSSLSASLVVSTNNVNAEKNQNGFAKFFSRSKNGIQLEI
ncbi:hypothetical protein K2173_028547 [Erythroxylum novogranatense]|uniref:Filament-like plant protein n=1 Tax=Erythroxylum novogranatense TaxID=1862640 RepID=A0AAV8U5Y7_9ROSI|nr:hypothetical protein K2173_028547 [Erythroxylum novogranatense]